jgi:hypothetical protein
MFMCMACVWHARCAARTWGLDRAGSVQTGATRFPRCHSQRVSVSLCCVWRTFYHCTVGLPVVWPGSRLRGQPVSGNGGCCNAAVVVAPACLHSVCCRDGGVGAVVQRCTARIV